MARKYPESITSSHAGLGHKLRTQDSAAAFQHLKLMIITLEKKPRFIGREQLVTQMGQSSGSDMLHFS